MKQYQIDITKGFAALEDLSDDEDINRAWENIKENIRTLAKESLDLNDLKRHEPRVDEERKGFFFKKKAKMQWLHHPSQSNADNLNNVRRNASRHLRNKINHI